ncbi:2-oxoadipate dioxygenase/decarboxylase [Arthrobacter rhombi]|uniref:2-oxoadipate dioxygenase/decarboxylase n=1 Tax=Arthrobacter rhombi TaxID=71253 RepID=UPI003FD4478A
MPFLHTWQLRAEFALRLSQMYGEEVPAYNTLVEVSSHVNQDFMDRHGSDAERLGTLERVTAERHGAIRVGSPQELASVARVFAAFGMHPVGFYDLRDASSSSVPVIATAFRPVDEDELAKNPFRVFTSLLATEDPRFFNEELQRELREFIDSRSLFPDGLLELADRAAVGQGLDSDEAERLLHLATSVFQLSSEPVDDAWYRKLEAISAVAADIGGVSSTHINHLTPRVLDIDDLYQRMEDRGIKMIDAIQGPPRWNGPDVLLRQTSFRALDEERTFRFADGSEGQGKLRVRFGEVEQRGVALTRKGRDLYEEMNAEIDRRMTSGDSRSRVSETVWQEMLPGTDAELAAQDLAFYTYSSSASQGEVPDGASLAELVTAGTVELNPIVYEDFLPRSAAGIFQSNLREAGQRDDAQEGTLYDMDRLSEIIGLPIKDPVDLYRAQQDASLSELEKQLGVTLRQ